MKHNVHWRLKFWMLIIGLGLLAIPPAKVNAQISYWGNLGYTAPFRNAGAGPAFCMLYNKGLLYVPFTDSLNDIELGVWNGNTWQYDSLPLDFDIADSFQSGNVGCMAADDSGHIYMGGWFTDTSGAIVIKWDGVNWSKVGEGTRGLHTNNCNGCIIHGFNGFNQITSMCFDQSNNLYVGGDFVNSQGNEYVAKWNGTNWSALDSLGVTTVLNIHTNYVVYNGGGLGAYGGYIYATATTGIIRWDGNTWSNIDAPNSHIAEDFVISRTGDIYASMGNYVAKWDGNTWIQLGNSAPNILNLYIDTNENLYGIGDYENSSGNNYVTKWDGNNWVELGTNNFALHANQFIYGLALTPSADSAFATGDFSNSLGLNYVALYSTLPAGRLFVYLSATGANCGNTGKITSTVYQGTPPYTYSWNNGDTTGNPNSLASGNYFVTVTDAHGLIATGDIYVSGGCSSIIAGTVFVDTSGNCIYNGQQPIIPNLTITLSGESQTLYATTDANGNYTFDVGDTGNYHLYIQEGNNAICGNFTLCGNPSQVIHAGVLGDTVSGNNFALTPDTNSFDLYLHPGWTASDPGFEKDYWIYFANNDPVPFNGTATVAFKYDSALTFVSSDVAYNSYNASTDSITWVVNNFTNTGWNYIGRVRFQVPATVPIDYQLHSQFWIYPYTADCDTSNNYLQYYETVVGSHDPNYKEVSPSGGLNNADSVLTYTIHYQNTGTDSTYFVTVIDTLSPYLNPATVNNLASSDSYSKFSISGKGILTWVFSPLSLPAVATDSIASNGFITFSVKKMANVPVGTYISNTATIYFDYNTGIVTNAATDSTICSNGSRITQSICSGDTFYIGSSPYTQSGTYIDTLTNTTGCDSIVTLMLTVKPILTTIQNLAICQGDSAQLNHTWYHQPGTYSDTLTAASGCDSIAILNLAVNLILHQSITTTICSTNPFYIGNTPYDSTGNYTDTITSSLGCDSVVNLNLTVKPASEVFLNWDALYVLNLLDASSGQATAYWCHGDYPDVIPIAAAGIPAGGTFTGAGISNDSLYADLLLLAGVNSDTISYYYADADGCNQTAVGYINFLYCLGVQQINGSSSLTVYPNPSNNQLFIKPENIQPQTITIYDVDGRIIQTMPFKSELDVNNLSPGVYFIELRNATDVARKPFVKM